tara:strand:+ start:311 stop:1186 length:876 start_codon:yes stop_codon:yes gene_type:complete
MTPNLSDLRKIARKRSKYLRDSEKGLMSRAASMQRKLNAYVLNMLVPTFQMRNNRLTNTANNLNKVNNVSGLKKFMKNVVDLAMLEYYENQFTGINRLSNQYFNKFEPTEATKERIISRGQTITDGFVDELFDNNEIIKDIQNTIRNSIITEQRTTDLKQLLTDQIKGKNDKLGSVQSYHYKNGFDQFQSYSRSLDEQYSKALKLNYAFYAGGKIKSTRDFCQQRSGNLYNRETILGWNNTPATWAGRKPNNNILIDMGGYNCRHDLDWVSWELAQQIDPNIERSKFDKVT